MLDKQWNPPPWFTEEVRLTEADYMACAYNAAVNSDVPRGAKKMRDLIQSINYHERIEGRAKLRYLVQKGIIDSFKGCPPECHMRPGGLFHAKDCENEPNHPIYRERQRKARAELPGKDEGWWVATVRLVAEPNEVRTIQEEPK
ncbi:MAG TPA: hypothetical protein VGK54_09490 [Chloroflexota bacterium]|jgi:hypothetical protein